MEPEDSFPFPQEPAADTYREWDASSTYLLTRKIHPNIILPSTPRSSEPSLPFRLSNQNFYAFLISSMSATCPAHLILDFINMIISGNEYKLWSSRKWILKVSFGISDLNLCIAKKYPRLKNVELSHFFDEKSNASGNYRYSMWSTPGIGNGATWVWDIGWSVTRRG